MQKDKQIIEMARRLLEGEISPDEFIAYGPKWCAAQVDNGLTDASLDIGRRQRCGFPEVVYAEGKSAPVLRQIAKRLLQHEPDILMTRVCDDQVKLLREEFGSLLTHNEVARTVRLNKSKEQPKVVQGHVCVVTAGTTDIPVAEEARETIAWMGVGNELIADVGVAGPQRLLANVPKFQQAQAIVVVAGMEGALPSVVAGHVACPIFAVPTSVGYGANFGGVAALLSMLNSCAANVAVVNIDAGFKAGYLAGLVASRRQRPSGTENE